jgi:large conductance mechanosensitive channel
MGMMQEFKEFAMKGNVVDMAVGLVIGAAFGKIIASLVADVIMPPIGMLMGGIDFTQLYVSLGEGTFATLAEATAAGAPVIKYGQFIQTIVDFLIIAFSIFMIVRAMNKAKKKEEAAPAAPAEDIVLLKEIRDALKK